MPTFTPASTDADGHANTNTNTDTHADTDADLYADANTDAHADTDADLYSDTDADLYPDANTDAHADTDADLYPDADTDAHADTDGHGDTNTDAHPDANGHADTDADAHTNAFTHTNANIHSDSNIEPYTVAVGVDDSATHSHQHTDADECANVYPGAYGNNYAQPNAGGDVATASRHAATDAGGRPSGDDGPAQWRRRAGAEPALWPRTRQPGCHAGSRRWLCDDVSRLPAPGAAEVMTRVPASVAPVFAASRGATRGALYTEAEVRPVLDSCLRRSYTVGEFAPTLTPPHPGGWNFAAGAFNCISPAVYKAPA